MDPLDLFSEENTPKRRHLSSSHYKPSSPIEDTETIRELRLSEDNGALLKEKKALEKDILDLETRWNELQTKNKEDLQAMDAEEDEIIYQILLGKVHEEKQVPVEGDIDENVEVEENKYDAKPLRDWEKRIEFIKRFYQELEVTNVISRLKLEYEVGVKFLVKTISFTITYPKLISFEVDVRLKKQKESSSYTVWKLEIRKLSNNQLNTILIKIQSHFIKTKNINQFLYTSNCLYQAIKTRHALFMALQSTYKTKTKITALTTSFPYNDLNINYDIVFDVKLEKITTVISANDAKWNKVLLDLIEFYGIKLGIERLFRHYKELFQVNIV